MGQKNVGKGGGSPSISITPLPGRNNPGAGASKKPSPAAGAQQAMKPGQPGQGQGKGNFVICEICDGYIKDLEQLRNHMQWIHKVISRDMHHHASHTLIIRSRFTPR